jgi:hypothetical protein
MDEGIDVGLAGADEVNALGAAVNGVEGLALPQPIVIIPIRTRQNAPRRTIVIPPVRVYYRRSPSQVPGIAISTCRR